MKRFLKKRWLGIPVGIIATVLIGTIVLAAVVYSVTQTITQTITQPPEPPDYGTITVADIDLPNLKAGGESFGSVFPNHVTVVLRDDGVGHHLWLELDEDILYASYEVKLTCKTSADETTVPIGTTVIVDMVNWRNSIPLGAAGTYVFDEYIHLRTGAAWGEASTNFKIAFSTIAAP